MQVRGTTWRRGEGFGCDLGSAAQELVQGGACGLVPGPVLGQDALRELLVAVVTVALEALVRSPQRVQGGCWNADSALVGPPACPRCLV